MASGLIKRVRRQLKGKLHRKTVSPSPHRRLNRWFLWLAPGIFIKRWLFISVLGVLLTSIGIANWANLTPIRHLIDLTSSLLETVASIIPNYI